MALSPGTRIGPYEIAALIGAGGMGEVYRATDTNLKRTVAIKVLPDSLASNTDRLARFQREAEVLASLNHPNIAQIHGFERGPADAGHYTQALVMEFVEGPSLADRIAFGPIPIDEALSLARQIAEALESAHERSIIHRDLKPANVKVRPDGTVKVLDFGLARAFDASSSISSSVETLANSPTITSPAMTAAGVILGTAAYMSPEQARGQVVDRRADVWAFGCVLFEMLTGRRVFDGSSVVDAIGAALHKDPEWHLLPKTTPPAVRATLERCLQKDPRQRARDLGDVRLALDGGFSPPAIAAPVSATSRPRLWPLAMAVLATALIVGPAAWMARRPPTTPARAPVRFQIPAPAGTEFGNFFSLSPDGRTLVFQALEVGRGQRYWLHSFDTNTSRLLTRVNPNNSSQFWSPDGRYFAFSEAGELKRLDISGGPPEVITTLAKNFGGGTWGSDGTILFGSPTGPLMRVPASGGAAVAVTTLDAERQETGHLNPWLLRDGRHFLYMRNSRVPGNSGLWVGSLDVAPDAQPKARLLAALQGAILAPGTGDEPDYVLFTRDGSLVAQVFDMKTLSLVGDVTQIAERVGIGPATYTQAWVSSSGTLVYRIPESPSGGTPAFFDRTGRERGAVPGINDAPALYPRLSPDGTRLAIFVAGDLWVYDLSGHPPVRLTSSGQGYSPLWTPDGKRIVFEQSGSVGLKMVSADGTGITPTSVTPPGHYHPLAFSKDGQFLISTMIPTNRENWKLLHGPFSADKAPNPVFESSTSDGFGGAAVSPDGRWLAYQSMVTGTPEIWVRPYPGAGSPIRISSNRGNEPIWNRNGRELFYTQGEDIMSVTVDTSRGGFAFTPAVRLFGVRGPLATQPPSYDVAPDGSFLMMKTLPIVRAPLEVVLNWRGLIGQPAAVATEH
jgi:eukaryotic-like serine/threonine-protein kinase